ncbi:hypothetical protein [Leisingera daeponensis]|uniref:hypothetical protein n=1 Tax=Leisingera daeponensis TaxID=405746 RepID=UPI00040B8BDD|nr:hypothetical protein [Leisingera daeponensis]
MKLVVRQYVQGLKERDELDVLLPQLLSEIGYEVIHHPGRGTKQAGVDVAAVGPDPDADGEKALHLFLIKSGDLGRTDWNGGKPQDVMPSLDEIRYDYIPNRVPEQYSKLPISICICMGGELKEVIRSYWRGYVEKNTTDNIRYREWNGDRLANLILSGFLNRELLDVDRRVAFQKAVAMVSEPDTSYRHFRELIHELTEEIEDDHRGTTRLRQLVICLWILVSNGVDAENLEAPYRCSELALLYSWDVLNRSASAKKKERKARSEIVDHVLSLYLTIGQKLIVEKIGPHADKKHAISSAVRSGSELDINLALFEAMGRSALLGLWHHFIGVKSDGKQSEQHLRLRDQCQNIAVSLINQNPTLTTPLRDDHHIEIGLLMLLAQGGGDVPNISGYLVEIASRLNYRYRLRKSWPTHFQDYRELARHPVDLSDEYFKKSTKGSVLVPFLKVSLERIQETEQLAALEKTIAEELPDMTQQVWVPRDGSEEFFWRQGTSQGIAIPVPMMELEEKRSSLASQIDDIAENFRAFFEMSAVKKGLVPLFLMACRHHRLPLPPHLWFQVENSACKDVENGSELSS